MEMALHRFLVRRAAIILTLSAAGPVAPVAASQDGGIRPLVDWAWNWRAGDEHEIVVFLEPADAQVAAELVFDGYATYGAHDPDRVMQGSVQVGAFFARITPDWIEPGNRIRFTVGDHRALPFDDGGALDCKVDLRIEGAVLVVRDNGACGGANVSFSGRYRKAGAE